MADNLTIVPDQPSPQAPLQIIPDQPPPAATSTVVPDQVSAVPPPTIVPDQPPVQDAGGTQPGFFSGLFRGVGEAAKGIGQTVTGPFQDRQVQQTNDALQQELQKPFSQGWSDPSWWTSQIGYGLGSSSPMVAGSLAGAAGITAAAGPEAAPIGAIGGAIAGNAMQQLAQSYQHARAEGLDQNAAVDRALIETGIGSTVVGAMSALPGGKFLGDWAQGTLKRAVTEAMVNVFGLQPAIGAAGQAATAAVENKPLTLDDLLTGYVQNATTGAAFQGAHEIARRVLPAPAPQGEPTALQNTSPEPETASAVPPPVPTPSPGDALLRAMQERAPGPLDEQVVNNDQGLYVNRPVLNSQEIYDWARRNGIPEAVPPEDMHATQLYSRTTPEDLAPLTNEISALPGQIAPLGDEGALVAHITSPEMQQRHADLMQLGATHDYPEYQPHVTIGMTQPGFDASKISEPMPPVRLGPEVHAPLEAPQPALRGPIIPDQRPGENGASAERVLPLSSAVVNPEQPVHPGHVADGLQEAHTQVGDMLAGTSGDGKPPPPGAPPPPPGGLPGMGGRMAGVINNMPDDPLSIQRMSWVSRFLSLAQGLAARDRTSADYLNSVLDRTAARESLMWDGANSIRDYGRMSEAERAPVDKAIEYQRMSGQEFEPTDKAMTITVDPDAFGEVGKKNWPLQLSRPGEQVKLNDKQVAALNGTRDFLDRAWKQLAEAQARRFGYDGPFLVRSANGRMDFDFSALRKAYNTATDRGLKRSAERALQIAEAAAGRQRAAYFPLMRYGDWTIRVTPKAPMTGTGHPAPGETYFTKIESQAPFDTLRGTVKNRYGNTPPRKVIDEISRLKKRYDPKDYHIEVTKPQGRLGQVLDMPMIERALSDVTVRDPVTGEMLKDEVIEKLYQEMLAGFRRPSENIPGYSTDFRRALGDYVRQWSGVTANALHGRRVDDTYLQTQVHRDPQVASYWRAHRTYNDSNESRVWSAARKIGFFKYLWGSPTSAILQLTQTPMITGSQLAGVIGPRGAVMVNTALARALSAMRADSNGVRIDPTKVVGITPQERAGLVQAMKEGRLNPVLPKDLAGGTLDAQMRKAHPIASKVYDAGSSMFNAADTANRIASWLSYYRAAQLPGAREQFSRAYKNDALFQAAVGDTVDPTKLANWATNETQFLSGRVGGAPVMRGVGSMLFQFQHYNANYLRLLYKNFTRMGPQGRAAGIMMLGALAGAAGLGGLPFANDLEQLTDSAMKMATGIEPRLDAEIREMLGDNGFAHMADNYMGWTAGTTGEVLMDGPSRLTGVDLGRRIGLGNLLPGSTDLTRGVPFLSATIGAAQEAYNRYQSGQGAMSAIAALMPAGIANPLKAYGVYPQQGIVSQTGQTSYFMPSEITPGMQAARALGATPAAVARRQEKMADMNAVKYATDQPAKDLLASIAGEYARAEDARKQGDMAAVAQHQAAAQGYIEANIEKLKDSSIRDWQKVPMPAASKIRHKMIQLLMPLQPGNSPALRMKQGELGDSPYLSQ